VVIDAGPQATDSVAGADEWVERTAVALKCSSPEEGVADLISGSVLVIVAGPQATDSVAGADEWMARAAIESFSMPLVLPEAVSVVVGSGLSSAGGDVGLDCGGGGRTAAASRAGARTFAPSDPKYQHFWRVERSVR
jgi:hypothetical protein